MKIKFTHADMYKQLLSLTATVLNKLETENERLKMENERLKEIEKNYIESMGKYRY